MQQNNNYYSVSECASLCGVGRGTVHYWIKTQKLHADRSGKSYKVHAQEILLFIKNSNRPLPKELSELISPAPLFGATRMCWDYKHSDAEGSSRCRDCVVYKRKIDICFAARNSSRIKCGESCNSCKFYQQFFFPRIHFIHQIDMPALITRDLYILSGNWLFAEKCGLNTDEIPGMGIEQIVHRDSLRRIMGIIRKKNIGDKNIPKQYTIYIKALNSIKTHVDISVYPLKDPKYSTLIIGGKLDLAQSINQDTF